MSNSKVHGIVSIIAKAIVTVGVVLLGFFAITTFNDTQKQESVSGIWDPNSYCKTDDGEQNEKQTVQCLSESTMLMSAEHDRETILASIWGAAFIVSLLIAIDIFTRRDCKCENSKSAKATKK